MGGGQTEMAILKKLWATKRRRWATVVVVLVVLGAVSHGQNKKVEVEVAPAETGPLMLTIAASGKVDGPASDLSFNDSGKIVELYVEEGDPVQEGQTLARIEPGLQFGQSGGALDVILSPYDGYVVTISRREGAVVNQGVPVLRVVRRGEMWVTAYIDAEDAVHLHDGQRFDCRAGGYLSRPWPLEVKSIGHEAVQREDVPGSARQVRVRLVPVGVGFGLPVGTPVDLDGEVPLLDHALLIPAAAVVREDGQAYVWVVEGERVRQVDIRIGDNNFREVVVLSGLTEGQQVVVSGKTDLKPDTLVKTKLLEERQS